MIVQLNPPIPVVTPKGPALAHALIDQGIEHNLLWICFLDHSGECWTFVNQCIRAQKNITYGREYISPFYNPDDVAFTKEFKEKLKDELYEKETDETDWKKSYSDLLESFDDLVDDYQKMEKNYENAVDNHNDCFQELSEQENQNKLLKSIILHMKLKYFKDSFKEVFLSENKEMDTLINEIE